MKIQLSDALSLLAITISFLTLIISVYFQFTKPPKLIITLGDQLKLAYQETGNLVLFPNLSFFNLGARHLGIRKVVGTITRRSDSLAVNFQWQQFFKAKNIGAAGKPQKLWNDFDGPLETIIVAGYQGVNKSVIFVTDKPFDLTQGIYDIEFIAYTIPNWKDPTHSKHILQIEQNASIYLKEKCKAKKDGTTEDTLMLWLTTKDDSSRK